MEEGNIVWTECGCTLQLSGSISAGFNCIANYLIELLHQGEIRETFPGLHVVIE